MTQITIYNDTDGSVIFIDPSNPSEWLFGSSKDDTQSFADWIFGADIIIVGKTSAYIDHNITEFHWKYNSTIITDERFACESDIHSTGITRNCNDIVKIIIIRARYKNTKF